MNPTTKKEILQEWRNTRNIVYTCGNDEYGSMIIDVSAKEKADEDFWLEKLDHLLEVKIKAIEGKKEIPVVIPHHNPYLSGFNSALDLATSILKE